MKKSLFFIFCLLLKNLTAEIVESKNLEDVFSYLKPNTLILFDLDNTLIEPVQMLGSHFWFENQIHERIQNGIPPKEALDHSVEEYLVYQVLTKVKTIQDNAPDILKKLQDQKLFVLGLTVRNWELSHWTKRQLESVKIDFSINPLYPKTYYEDLFLYRDNILYTTGQNKALALFAFLQKASYTPDGIIFVEDTRKNLVEMEKYCTEKKIPFTGIFYTKILDKPEKFDPKIAKIEEKYSAKLLSDEEAKKIYAEGRESK